MKKEREQLKIFLLFLFTLLVLSLSTSTSAALSLQPVVPGYSSAAGVYRVPAGSFTMAAANSGFIQPAVTSVAGKPITVPASLRMAANAGQFAKNAIKLNPYAIAGTLAAGWLIDQGLQWAEDNQQWEKFVPPDAVGGHPALSDSSWICSLNGQTGTASSCAAAAGWSQSTWPVVQVTIIQTTPTPAANAECSDGAATYVCASLSRPAGYIPPRNPFDDWAALPDPLPVVAPELPYAPYMPDGVPVDAPNYDFSPFSAPLGQPYTKADGSTAQPMAKVSPNGDSVTVDTYDQPLTTPDGQPSPNPTPQDTPEPDRDPCLDHPERLGCMNAGSDNFTVPKNSINFTFTPEASFLPSGGCPAPISVLGQSISYQPACDAMSMIRPVVLGMASIMAAYILLGAFKGGD